MNDPQATFVATVHPFVATDRTLRRRHLARKAKARRDPGGLVLFTSLAEEIRSAILSFEPSCVDSLAAWFGSADRLAHAHPSGVLELLVEPDAPGKCPESDETGHLEFISVVGPRSYRPEREAAAYRAALDSLTGDEEGIESAARAARALVDEARACERRWSSDEWHSRVLAGIAAWIYWDDEPGAVEVM